MEVILNMSALKPDTKPRGRIIKHTNGVTSKLVMGAITGNCLKYKATIGAVPITAAMGINRAVSTFA
jgi:hypothetical protein